MGDIMMLASMATHHVPSLPARDPTPTDIHLDDDPKIIEYDISNTTVSPLPESTEPGLVSTQTHVGRVETSETTSQIPTSAGAEAGTPSLELQVDSDTNNTLQANSDAEAVQVDLTSSSPTQISDNNYTASAPVNDVTSKTIATSRGAAGQEVAVIAIGTAPCPEQVRSTESHEAEVTEPEVIEFESPEATKIQSTIDNAAAPELESTRTETSEQADLGVVDISSDDNENDCPENLNRSKVVAENTHIQGDLDHLKIASELMSSDNDPSLATEPNSDDDQPNDMSAQVARLAATYNPSGESSTSQIDAGSNTPKGKLPDDTTAQVARLAATYGSSGRDPISQLEAGRNAEKTEVHPGEQRSQDNDEVMTTKLAVNDQTSVETPESNAQKHVELLVAAESRVSLFGGPAGPQVPLQSDILETSGIESVVQIDPSEGFDGLFEDEVAGGPMLPDNILQEDTGVDMDSFHFSNSNIEQDAKHVADVEPEVDAGAEQETFSQPPNLDYDAKPDMNASFDPTSPNFSYSPTSPTYSHATSNNSNASKKSSASELQEVMDLMYYNTADDVKETPEELARLEQGIPGHSVSESIKEPSPCTCEHHCRHRVCKEFNLREGPRKEDCVYFNNLVYDNDQSGTYTDEQKKFPSSQKVDVEDLDDDEESVGNGGAGDHIMGDGLTTDSMGRYSNTIPFNHTDTLIRDKRVFDEESSSSDESQPKSKKKRKSTKTKSSKATKKSKNNNGKAIQRTTESAEEDIEIDEQASTPAPKATTKSTKKIHSTAEPNQTIVQMLQRLAKPHLTKLSYPVVFNSPAASCSICNSPSYAVHGCSSTPRKIKIYDSGQGNTEIPDANQAGNAMTMAVKPKDTNLCLVCTTSYMKILMCSNHDISPTSAPSAPHSSSSSSSNLRLTCSVCPAPSTYTCDHNCGAKFCDTCASKVHGECNGSLSGMLDTIKDECSQEYTQGLRADVELLKKGGELWKFLGRMSRKKVAS